VSQSRAATLLLVALIVAAGAAFLNTQRLKLDHSPVGNPHVRQDFSPACTGNEGCRPEAVLEFTLREAQPVGLRIVDEGGDTVRTIAEPVKRPKGTVEERWDGRTDGGQQAPEGRYFLAVDLEGADRTVTIPDPIVLDTTPPTVHVTRVDRGRDAIVIHFLLSEQARSYRVVERDGEFDSQSRTKPQRTRFRFQDKPPGEYVVTVFARDQAGNESPNPPSVRVRLP
jgi:hypothetical protein